MPDTSVPPSPFGPLSIPDSPAWNIPQQDDDEQESTSSTSATGTDEGPPPQLHETFNGGIDNTPRQQQLHESMSPPTPREVPPPMTL
jgi:hypothetical protein